MMDDFQLENENEQDGKSEDSVLTADELRSKTWNRDTISERIQEVQAHNQQVEKQLRDLRKDFEATESFDDLKDEFDSFLDRVSKDERGNPSVYPRPFVEQMRERHRIKQKMAEWQGRRYEVNRVTVALIYQVFTSLLDEFRTAQSYETLEDALENKTKHHVDEVLDKKETKLDSKINQVEKLIQAFREERRSDRETIKELASAADGVDEDQVEEIIQRSLDSGLEQFVDENGVVILDDEELEQNRKDSERQGAAESSAENAVSDAGLEDSSEDLSVREQIVSDWEDQGLAEFTPGDVAEMYGTETELVEELIEEENLN
jgi:hypothetical protein